MSDGVPQPDQPGQLPDLDTVDTGWRRLNRRMLLIHPVQEAIRFLPAFLGIFILRISRDDGGHYWELAGLMLVVALGLLRYFTTRFRIENGQIELRKGLFTKQVIATPADRVRTVDLTSPFFHRILGLARVEIGTAGAKGERLTLDALTVSEARLLREELIHQRRLHGDKASAPAEPSDATEPTGIPTSSDREPVETTLAVLDPTWVRYAPLTITGLLSALAIFGFANQLIRAAFEQGYARDAFGSLGEHTWWVDLLVGLVVLVVLVSVLAVVGYVLQFWGFRLTRHRGGTLHVARGLVTTRETSIEEKRLRGVEVGEPLGLRLAGAGRLRAITTGLSRREDDRGAAWLVPPAPTDVVAAVAAAVVDDTDALTAPLTQHGPAALRRRWIRALWPAVVLAAGVFAMVRWQDWPWGIAVVGLLPLLAAPALALDRYAGLGHHLSGHHLVVRSGSFSRRRDVLQRTGIIGWTWHSSWFQRRVGLTQLVATTAAGKQSYTAYDIGQQEAVALALEVDPAIVGQFLVAEPTRATGA